MHRKLWNRDFTILWQGQLISDFGNAAFSVALGFWVLAVTKSTLQMGAILACFAIPSVVLGPFAGVLADRFNKKWIIVLADFTRGLVFTLMGITVLYNVFPFVLIYPLAILVGSCGAFFNPAATSALPDIVPTSELSKAISARSFSGALTQLLGNSMGGFLFSLLTAPVMILINGIALLYAAITQLFMHIPIVIHPQEKKHILHDMLDGMKYTFKTRGIRTLIITGMFINFFASIGVTLLTPLFMHTEGFGVAMYGLVMGTMMIGSLLGMAMLTFVKFKPSSRYTVFMLTAAIMVVCMIPVGFIRNVLFMFPIALIAGFAIATVNVMMQTIIQIRVAPENRGKVFGILATVMGGLAPLAMASSGAIAEIATVRGTIIGAFVLMAFTILPLFLDRSLKEFINADDTQAQLNPIQDTTPPDARDESQDT